MKELPYREGTWFAIPLREGKYVVGRVARHSPKGGIVLAYLFGPKRDRLPAVDELGSLKPEDAIKVWRIGDLGLINGKWQIIGDAEDWLREQWPVPNFIRKPDTAHLGWRVVYSDTDPNCILEEQKVLFETESLEKDALFGYVAAESVLSNIL